MTFRCRLNTVFFLTFACHPIHTEGLLEGAPCISNAAAPSLGLPAQLPGKGPTVLSRFTATVQQAHGLPFAPNSSLSNGTLVYDADIRRFSMEYSAKLGSFGPDATFHTRQVAVGGSMSSVTNGQCVNTSGPMAQGGFDGLFGWLALATLVGHDSVQGVTCDVWNFTHPGGQSSLCIAGEVPLYLADTWRGKMLFSDIKRTVNRSELEVPDLCMVPPRLCGNGSIAKQTIYVAHPRDNYNISGQDVADLRGDAVFLCQDKMMWKMGGYHLFSAFELDLVHTFGQYTNFPPPGGFGFGGDGFHVGRETPLGIGRHGGQCEDDADWQAKLGQWLSLPTGSQCLLESQVLGEDCLWRVARRIKTIEMACLFDQHHFLDKCAKSQPPFDDVTEVLMRALNSDNATHGGCPKVTAPQCSIHPSCAHLTGDCCPHQDGKMLECCFEPSSSTAAIVV